MWPYCVSWSFANLRDAPGVWSNISCWINDSMLIACVECPYKGHATAVWCGVCHLGDILKTVPFVCCSSGYCGLLQRLMSSDRVYLGIVNDMVLPSVSVKCWLVRCESSDSFEIASVSCSKCRESCISWDRLLGQCSVRLKGSLASCHGIFLVGSWLHKPFTVQISCSR